VDDPALEFDLLSASIRADARDLVLFLDVLAGKLQGALPSAVTVEHEGGLFSRKKVKRLRVQLAEHHFDLSRSGQGLEASHSHSVRGITLKTESVGVDEWIELLSRQVAEHARMNAQARSALNSMLQQ